MMLATLLLCAQAIVASPAAQEPPAPAQIRAAVVRALGPLQVSLREYPNQRGCFSCHNQAVPALALTVARDHGFTIQPEALEAAQAVTEGDLLNDLELYRQSKGQPGGVTRAGYALWTLALAAHPRDDTTNAVAAFLLGKDDADGAWKTSSSRPPSEASLFTTTLVALRALEAYTPPESAARRAERVAHARAWLEANPARKADTEDHAFRLMGLALAGSTDETIAAAANNLLALQRDDGGWAQIDGRDSDSYATGSALYALHVAGKLAVDSPAYQKGVAYLMKTQREDGTWHVVSRSKPFQPYFESGFPHGKDQFISVAASAWATAALALASPADAPQP